MSLEIANKDTMVERADAIRAASATAGAQRSIAAAALAKLRNAHAFSVPWGKSYSRMSGSSVFTPEKDDDDTRVEFENAASSRFFVHDELKATLPAGCAPLNKVVDGMPIPYGVCVLVGGTGVGKTPLAHHLASAEVESYAIVRAGEPFSGYDMAHKTLAADLGMAMLQSSDVVVDSIKDLLSDGKSLMKGGISRTALLELSAWSVLGATLGTTLYVPLNPSDDDAELIRMMATSAMSNATMMMVHDTDGSWKYTSRQGEGMERNKGTFRFRRDIEVTPTKTPLTRVNHELFVRGEVDVSDALKGVLDRNRAWSK